MSSPQTNKDNTDTFEFGERDYLYENPPRQYCLSPRPCFEQLIKDLIKHDDWLKDFDRNIMGTDEERLAYLRKLHDDPCPNFASVLFGLFQIPNDDDIIKSELELEAFLHAKNASFGFPPLSLIDAGQDVTRAYLQSIFDNFPKAIVSDLWGRLSIYSSYQLHIHPCKQNCGHSGIERATHFGIMSQRDLDSWFSSTGTKCTRMLFI